MPQIGDRAKARGQMLWSSGVLKTATSAFLVALMTAELLHLYGGSQIARLLAWGALLGFFAASLSRVGLRERALLVVCLSLSAALALRGEQDAVMRALDQVAFLAAFIQLMGLLREAAVRSAAVREVGAYLTKQPPKRRNLAVLAGGHGFGVLLNFGALSLLAPLIQRGVRATSPDPEIAQIRERRQLSALIRGFAWIVVWAPTTITQALLDENLSGLDQPRLLVLGLAAAIVMLGLAWIEGHLSWRATAARLQGSGRLVRETPRLPRRAATNLAMICALLIGATIATSWLAGVPTVPALMLTAPLCLVAWTLLQNASKDKRGALRQTGRDLSAMAWGAVPDSARESATLAASGFIGIAAAALAPVETIALWLAALQLDPALFLTALPLLIILAGQIALSPVMMVVFLAAAISALPSAPVDQTLAAFALSCGWALTMTGAPNAARALIMARITGRSAYELSWQWNLRFTLIALAVLAAIFTAATRSW